MLTLGDLQGVLLIRDSLESDGAFLLLKLLKLALQAPDGCDVVLVAARHTTAHYTQTLRKAGVSLPALVEQQRLGVVDVMHRLAQAANTQERLVDLRGLVNEVVSLPAAGDGGGGVGRPWCLLVDDLTVLRCVAADAEACWPAFLNSCCSLGSTLQRPFCFVGLAHGDVEDDSPWLARLAARASVVADVEALEAGFSREVSGRVVVTRREAPFPSEGPSGAPLPAGLGQQLAYYGMQGASAVFLTEGTAGHWRL